MNESLKSVIWSQFGASIDTLENAVSACPEEIWAEEAFWYRAYHTLFWLDYYLSETPDSFKPPTPFTLSELDPKGSLPERRYSKDELLTYLAHGRQKCRNVIDALTDDDITKPDAMRSGTLTVVELLLYNMRHVQHHSAQLNLLLRQRIDSAPPWISKAGVKPKMRS